jgi:hypothetical protein
MQSATLLEHKIVKEDDVNDSCLIIDNLVGGSEWYVVCSSTIVDKVIYDRRFSKVVDERGSIDNLHGSVEDGLHVNIQTG